MNAIKDKHLPITFKKSVDPIFTFNGHQIEVVTHHKHLGMLIDSHLSFNYQTNSMITKISRHVGIFKKIYKKCDGFTFFKSLQHMHNYCSTVWYPSKSQFQRIERIQRKFTKFISSKLGFNDIPYETRLRLLSMKSLVHRRQLHWYQTNEEVHFRRK